MKYFSGVKHFRCSRIINKCLQIKMEHLQFDGGSLKVMYYQYSNVRAFVFAQGLTIFQQYFLDSLSM